MKKTIKKLLESPNQADFIIGIELLYAKEGIDYFLKYDTNSYLCEYRKHRPKEFKIKYKITCGFFIIEHVSILQINDLWIIGTIESRLKTTAWTISSIQKHLIHEINPIYP